MATTSPTRIDDDLFSAAKLVGEIQSRSASQQVAHWARIGRELEASGSMSQKDIAEVLAGARSYDDLNPKEQAVVRAEWTTTMDDARKSLNFARDFASAGRGWVESDNNGAVVERNASSDVQVQLAADVAARPKRGKARGEQTGTGRTRTRN